MNKKACLCKQGFTLLELLVVIAIIAVIVAFAVTNFVGARQRARDIRKKAEFAQMKSALRLYYNDFTIYPGPDDDPATNTLNGCGADAIPDDPCSGAFSTGTTVYMKLLPPAEDYQWYYQRTANGDDFCLWTELDASADTEIAKSQARCSSVCSTIADTGSFVVCAD